MNAAEWRRRVRPLLEVKEEWAFRGKLCYRKASTWVVSGVLAEGSALQEGNYILAARIPLFVPSEVMVLDWSNRIGGGSTTYRVGSPEFDIAFRQAVVETKGDQLDAVISREAGQNALVIEGKSYGLLIRGRLPEAKRCLQKVCATDPEYEWVQQMIDRARKITDLLDSGLDAAVAQLRQWRESTSAALGLGLEAF